MIFITTLPVWFMIIGLILMRWQKVKDWAGVGQIRPVKRSRSSNSPAILGRWSAANELPLLLEADSSSQA